MVPSLLLSEYSLPISLILIKGITAKITIIPSVACGRLNNSGVANSNVIPTTIIVTIEESPLYAPLASLTADRENEPETGILPLMPELMFAIPWPKSS